LISRLQAAFTLGMALAGEAAAAPSGELLVMAPSVMRRATVEVDGRPAGSLPQNKTLELEPGEHQIAIQQGRWRLSASVAIRPGVRAVVRWPRPNAGDVSYLPTLGLVVEPADAPADLRQAVVDSIHRGRFAILGEYGTPAETPRPAGCVTTPACLEELAQAHGLRHVLSVQLNASPSGYMLDARLFDAETGDLASQRSDDCSSCSLTEARGRLGALCTDVIESGTHRPTGLLEVTSQPTGAEVLVDGRRLGVTPYLRPAGTGEHEVVVHKTGYLDYQNTVDVVPGRGSALDAVLRPDMTPPAKPPEPPAPRRVLSRRSRR